MHVTEEKELAAWLAGTLWGAVTLSGGPRAAALGHFPGSFDRARLAGLPLPVAGNLRPGQLAAVIGSDGCFHRHGDSTALRAAYEHHASTRVYEDIGWGPDAEEWAALAGRHMTRLAGGPRVTVTAYESAHGDEGIGLHRDMSLNVIVQVDGAKCWEAGGGLPGGAGGEVRQVIMLPGDVLVVPKKLPHLVTTPASPGWSVHLGFAVGRDLAGPGAEARDTSE